MRSFRALRKGALACAVLALLLAAIAWLHGGPQTMLAESALSDRRFREHDRMVRLRDSIAAFESLHGRRPEDVAEIVKFHDGLAFLLRENYQLRLHDDGGGVVAASPYPKFNEGRFRFVDASQRDHYAKYMRMVLMSDGSILEYAEYLRVTKSN